ncbi:hypothetical protein ACWD6R_14670 [Streptomyces sp. NPDC005151]
MARGGRLSGAVLFTGALAVCAVTRYSTALVPAALIAVAALASWLLRRPRHDLLLAGAATACAVAVALAMKLLGLPSSEVTLQDTFTRHFRSPDVPDPWALLTDLNLQYWSQGPPKRRGAALPWEDRTLSFTFRPSVSLRCPPRRLPATTAPRRPSS